jgi:hypothetical protein
MLLLHHGLEMLLLWVSQLLHAAHVLEASNVPSLGILLLELELLLLEIGLLQLLLLEATHSVVSSGVAAHVVHHELILALGRLLLMLLETPSLASVPVLVELLELEPGGQLMRCVHDVSLFVDVPVTQ